MHRFLGGAISGTPPHHSRAGIKGPWYCKYLADRKRNMQTILRLGGITCETDAIYRLPSAHAARMHVSDSGSRSLEMYDVDAVVRAVLTGLVWT